jgi:hypothetical protein
MKKTERPGLLSPSHLLTFSPCHLDTAAVVLAACALASVCAALYVVKHGGDVSVLTCTGANRAGQGPYRIVTRPIGPNGYDGQFYYAIAQAPWRTHQGELIDAPAARHLRILYPALCWLFSGGDPALLFWVMPGVNVLVVGVLAGLGAVLAQKHGRSAWWGLSLPLALNVLLPLLHNLTDPLSALMVCGMLVCWRLHSGPVPLALCALAALCCREQNLVVLGIIAAAALWRRDRGAVIGLTSAMLVWLAWVGVVWTAYGQKPFLDSAGNFDAPLAGMLYRWQHPGGNEHFSRRLSIFLVAAMLHLYVLLGLAAYWLCRPISRTLRLVLLAGVGLAVAAGPAIYGDFWSYTRVFVWIPVVLWLLALQTGSRWQLAALLSAAVWPIAAVLNYV